MFASYQNIINGAIVSESTIIENYDNKKESNTLKIKKKIHYQIKYIIISI